MICRRKVDWCYICSYFTTFNTRDWSCGISHQCASTRLQRLSSVPLPMAVDLEVSFIYLRLQASLGFSLPVLRNILVPRFCGTPAVSVSPGSLSRLSNCLRFQDQISSFLYHCAIPLRAESSQQFLTTGNDFTAPVLMSASIGILQITVGILSLADSLRNGRFRVQCFWRLFPIHGTPSPKRNTGGRPRYGL